MIPIVSPVVKDLFAGLDKDQVIRLAKDLAKDAYYNIILFMYGKVDFETLISWYMQRMRHCSDISQKDKGDSVTKIILKHEFGENWSLYHQTRIESICHDILKEPIKVDITNSTVNLNSKSKQKDKTMYLKDILYYYILLI